MIIARGTKFSVFDEPEAGIDLWSFNNLIQVFENMHQKIIRLPEESCQDSMTSRHILYLSEISRAKNMEAILLPLKLRLMVCG